MTPMRYTQTEIIPRVDAMIEPARRDIMAHLRRTTVAAVRRAAGWPDAEPRVRWTIKRGEGFAADSIFARLDVTLIVVPITLRELHERLYYALSAHYATTVRYPDNAVLVLHRDDLRGIYAEARAAVPWLQPALPSDPAVSGTAGWRFAGIPVVAGDVPPGSPVLRTDTAL